VTVAARLNTRLCTRRLGAVANGTGANTRRLLISIGADASLVTDVARGRSSRPTERRSRLMRSSRTRRGCSSASSISSGHAARRHRGRELPVLHPGQWIAFFAGGKLKKASVTADRRSTRPMPNRVVAGRGSTMTRSSSVRPADKQQLLRRTAEVTEFGTLSPECRHNAGPRRFRAAGGSVYGALSTTASFDAANIVVALIPADASAKAARRKLS
jgi:hypothetical protein